MWFDARGFHEICLIEALTNHFSMKPLKNQGAGAVWVFSSCLSLQFLCGNYNCAPGTGVGLQGEQLLQAGQMWALSPFPELPGAVLSSFTSLSASRAGLVSSRGLYFYFLMDEHPGNCAGPSLGSSLPVLKLCCVQFPRNNNKKAPHPKDVLY